MARMPRTHYKGAAYHVMLRGNAKQTIFFDDASYLKFYHYLNEAIKTFDCKIHLFCLMSNHVHLVIEVSQIPLPKIMQSIASNYAAYINHRFDRVGHLFQGRYLAKLVQSSNYLLELCFYIHNNPVIANIVSDINDYRWSSHHSYNKNHVLEWVTTKRLLELLFLKGEHHPIEEMYDLFIYDKSNYSNSEFCRFDSDNYLVINNDVDKKKSSYSIEDLSVLSIDEITECCCDFLNVAPNIISSESCKKEPVFARNMITYFCHYHARYKLCDLAVYLGRRPDSLTKSLHKCLKVKATHGVIHRIALKLGKKRLEKLDLLKR